VTHERSAKEFRVGWRNLLIVSLVGFAYLATTTRAAANGQFPAANQVVVAPNDPQMLVLRTTFGVLVSRDRGENWDWICEQAIGYPNGEEAFLGVTASSTIVGGTFGGLVLSSDHGCSWTGSRDLTSGSPIGDLTVSPAAPEVVVALSSAFMGGTQGQLSYATQLFATDDNGAHWARLGEPLTPTTKALTVEVSKSDPGRIYVSGTRARDDGSGWVGVLFVSRDAGAHWREWTLELTDDERAPYIAGVDPTNGDRVYVRTFGVTGRLLVSDDAGESFRAVFSGGQLLGFALSPDGSRVYVGGPVDGLWVADAAELQFEQKSDIAVRCLTASGRDLFVCSTEESGFTLGATQNEGDVLTPLLTYATIRGPLVCPSEASAAVCPSLWSNQRAALGIGGGTACATENGTSQAEGGAPPAVEEQATRSKHGCSMPPVPLANGTHVYVAVAITTSTLLRRRRKALQRGNHAKRY
jgi:photosystem II stability/assembly factor-like uncharacterized protein